MNRLAHHAVTAFLTLCTLLALLPARPASAATPAVTLQAGDIPQDLMTAAMQWYDASGERTLADWQRLFNAAASPVGASGAGLAWLNATQAPLG